MESHRDRRNCWHQTACDIPEKGLKLKVQKKENPSLVFINLKIQTQGSNTVLHINSNLAFSSEILPK